MSQQIQTEPRKCTLEEVVAESAEHLSQIVSVEMTRQTSAREMKPIAAESEAVTQDGQRIVLRLEVHPSPAKARRAEAAKN